MSSFIKFLGQVKAHQGVINLQAVTSRDTYTAGPLKVQLRAIQNGRVIFST
jgi:uncharacterized protein (DUF3084 family)